MFEQLSSPNQKKIVTLMIVSDDVIFKFTQKAKKAITF